MTTTVRYSDHPRDPKFVAVTHRWRLFRGFFFCYKNWRWDTM